MSEVAVSTNVLRWALERSGKSVQELEPRFPKIREWLSGDRVPSLRQLETLAKATMTPFGLLFLEQPPEDRLTIPHFRTIAGDIVERPSPNLIDTIHTMQRRQEWMREFMIKERQAPLPFVGSSQVVEHAVEVAQKIREVFGFNNDWASRERTWTEALRCLRETMEQEGIFVVVNGIVGNNTRRKLDPGEFRGFVLVDDHAPLVFVNGADGKAAQMFTLAHEIAHIFFGSSAVFDLRQMLPAKDKTEQACNQVAAEFLVPASLLQDVWSRVRNEEEPFQALARRFKVSEIVAARRAMDLKLITRKDFFSFYQMYREHERRTSGKSTGGDFYTNQNGRVGMRFGETIVRALSEGKLSYSEAYRLTGLQGRTFERFADTLIGRKGGS